MQYGLTIKTAPTVEPLTVDEAKNRCRVDIDDDDARIERHIASARKWCEDITRRAFITQTWNLWLSCWPAEIVLPKPPCSSVTSVKYRDDDGNWQTVDSSTYELDATEAPARIVLAHTKTWPSIITRRKAIDVEFVCGYGATASTVPEGIIDAIAARVCSLYDPDMPEDAALGLLGPYLVRDYALTQGG